MESCYQTDNFSSRLTSNPSVVSSSSEILEAVSRGDIIRLINLVNWGESLNVSDFFGNGPLHFAIFKSNFRMVDYLLMETRLINVPNFLGETPLFNAVCWGEYNLAKKLIHAGADANIPNNSQATPLHYAIITNLELAHLLIEHGANVDAATSINETPLHLAVRSGHLESVCMLLYYNANANCQDWKGYTPFMRAIEARNIEMQEVLIEYVVDFNDCTDEGWSILGLALAEDSPFVDEIIIRGADVNNVNNKENGAFFLSFKTRGGAYKELNPKTFKLIWDNMDYKISRWCSLLADLTSLETCQFEQVLDIIVQSDKFPRVAESVCIFDDLYTFTYKFAELKLPLKKYTEIFCMLLTYGYTPNSYDMTIIFNYYGYCELYRLLLFMDIRIEDEDGPVCVPCKIPTRLMYDVNFKPYELLQYFIYILYDGICSYDDYFSLVVIRLLDYCIYPKLINAYLKSNTTDCVTLKIKALPKVPSLKELARNATRNHIIRTFYVKNSCQLYTLINNLDISEVYKKILTFERVLYRPTFTLEEFKHFIKMIERCKVTRKSVLPIIQSASINTYISDFNG